MLSVGLVAFVGSSTLAAFIAAAIMTLRGCTRFQWGTWNGGWHARKLLHAARSPEGEVTEHGVVHEQPREVLRCTGTDDPSDGRLQAYPAVAAGEGFHPLRSPW